MKLPHKAVRSSVFLSQRNFEVDIHKDSLWIDPTPERPKPSPLLLRLLTRAGEYGILATSTDGDTYHVPHLQVG